MGNQVKPMTKTARRPGTPGDSNAPAQSPRKQLMENEVLEHATRLFRERGFAGTSLQDIAESMGLKRPALYYYFKSKDALLDRLIDEATSAPAQDLEAIGDRRDLDAAARLHAMACCIIDWVAGHTDIFLLMVKSEADLCPASAQRFNNGRRGALEAVRKVIEDGGKSGEFRTVDPQIAALGVWGICNWVAWWYSPEASQPIETIASQLADMAVSSLQRPEERGSKLTNPRDVITALRDDLDRLNDLLTSG